MTSLVRVEVRRILARRLTRVLALLAVAGILASGVVVFIRSHEDTSPVTAELVGKRDRIQCTTSYGVITSEQREGSTPEEVCADLAAQIHDTRWHLTELRDAWLGVGTQLIIVAWLLGASFIGAEWHSGTVTTLLTWEPRRTRVFFAKLLAAVLVVFVGTIALEALLGAALWPAAAFRGVTSGADGGWLADGVRLVLRAAVACSFAAGLGYGLAAVGRNTAASLGVGFVYLLVIESLVRGLKPDWARWLLGDNIAQFLGGASRNLVDGRSPVEAGLVIATYCGVALLAGLAFFRARDVT